MVEQQHAEGDLVNDSNLTWCLYSGYCSPVWMFLAQRCLSPGRDSVIHCKIKDTGNFPFLLCYIRGKHIFLRFNLSIQLLPQFLHTETVWTVTAFFSLLSKLKQRPCLYLKLCCLHCRLLNTKNILVFIYLYPQHVKNSDRYF